MRLSATCAMLLMAMVAPARAQESGAGPQVVARVAECRAIRTDAERLACFDRAAAALDEAVSKRTVVVLDKQEVRRTRRSLFGFSLPNLPFFGNDRKDDDEPDAEEVTRLDTSVTQVSQAGYSAYVVTLAEGGVWRFTESDRAFYPKAGDKITIKRGGLGNYMASLNGRRALRIVRVN